MGLPLACQIASRGAEVVACDTSRRVVDSINQGRMLFEEPGVDVLLSEAHKAGTIYATDDIGTGIRGCDVVIVIVPVLLTPGKEADLSVIEQVTTIIAGNLAPGMMVSYETTLPVGTTRRRLAPVLESSGLKAGIDFDLVFSPERVKSGFVLRNLTSVPKIVGGVNERSANRAEAFYCGYVGAPVINLESLEASELAKLAGMVYRDVNIALANELAAYSEQAGVEFPSVLAAANTDGEAMLLSPGIGVGGHCTPVYPYFVLQDAKARRVPMPLTESSRRLNDWQPARYLNRLAAAGIKLGGAAVGVLGLAFRPKVKEHICSPAFLIRAEAHKLGARVTLHDPLYSADEIRSHDFMPFDLSDDQLPSILILNTGHPEYVAVDFAEMRHRGVEHIVDGRNLWNGKDVINAGLTYAGPGV